MNANKGLTRVDVVIAAACVALVLAQAGVINAGGRERSKREVCLANLRTLTAAWQMYANDNAGKIVNGAPFNPSGSPPAGTCPAPPAGLSDQVKAIVPPISSAFYTMHKDELSWIGPAWAFNGTNWYSDRVQSECLQKVAINTGALWKYTGDYNIYRCPVGKKDAIVTYMIIDSMNGKYMWNYQISKTHNPAYMMAKNLSEIKGASGRIVFIDEGTVTPDSYAVYSGSEYWFDPPPVRHEGGVTVSFADGHSVYHKWKAKETIAKGSGDYYDFKPATCDAKNDLYWMQTGCWGELRYIPSCPVNLE
jgi:prepilin-type processing-associated H-X9-DG protein